MNINVIIFVKIVSLKIFASFQTIKKSGKYDANKRNLTGKFTTLTIASDTKFLTVDQWLFKSRALFMYHYHRNFLSKVFRNFFLTPKNKNMITRSNSQIILVSCSFTVSKQSVKFWGPWVWNQIPTNTRKSKTAHFFIQNIQPYLVQNKIKL